MWRNPSHLFQFSFPWVGLGDTSLANSANKGTWGCSASREQKSRAVGEACESGFRTGGRQNGPLMAPSLLIFPVSFLFSSVFAFCSLLSFRFFPRFCRCFRLCFQFPFSGKTGRYRSVNPFFETASEVQLQEENGALRGAIDSLEELLRMEEAASRVAVDGKKELQVHANYGGGGGAWRHASTRWHIRWLRSPWSLIWSLPMLGAPSGRPS